MPGKPPKKSRGQKCVTFLVILQDDGCQSLKPQVVGVTFSHLVTARLLMPEWLRHPEG